MSINFGKEVDYVARLARLKLKPEEKKVMAGQLSDIINTARKVQEVDTTGVEPTSHVIDLPTVLRDDKTGSSLTLNRVLQNAPRRHQDYFKVPSIMAKDNGFNEGKES